MWRQKIYMKLCYESVHQKLILYFVYARFYLQINLTNNRKESLYVTLSNMNDP
jgi:hypothetical protein